jgi:hypothetical protein
MKKVFFAVLAICMVASMSFAAQKTLKAEGPEFVCNDEMFGPIYTLNKYVVNSKIIPINTVEGTAAEEIPFVCEESWLAGMTNALNTGYEAENLAFPRHSVGIIGGAEAKQNTALCFKIKMPAGGAFFGMDIIFHQCATNVTDQLLPAGPYLPIYLIDDVFGFFQDGGESIIFLDISPDLGILIRGAKNNRLGPWDYFVVCDLDPNDYDNDGYYEAALGFRASPVGVSPIIDGAPKPSTEKSAAGS